MLLGYLFWNCFAIIAPKFGELFPPSLGMFCPLWWIIVPNFWELTTFQKNGDKQSQKNGTNNPQSWGQKFPKGDNKSPNLGTIIAQTWGQYLPNLGQTWGQEINT